MPPSPEWEECHIVPHGLRELPGKLHLHRDSWRREAAVVVETESWTKKREAWAALDWESDHPDLPLYHEELVVAPVGSQNYLHDSVGSGGW